ncbi:acyl-activating enzyme 13 [Arthroderma uncinatum]|uniref:acyl-activating enzyme 13 n=1 Tax=Arthroderma uncinatum TaxID=74035 RepID=UPI00144AD2B8|nr:acyl-activating enzyme 13 [Arthroderma uncinatum]KAF3482636.1 acyl-activating enzyme 13 [Arthroderma uncinatum]
MTVAVESQPRGDRVLPNEPFFKRLLTLAQLGDDHIAIHDPYRGVKASFPRFLNDVLATRDAIRHGTSPGLFDQRGMVYEERPYILLLAPFSYRYFVGFFAILALGGAAIPLSPSVSVNEAERFMDKSRASCLVFVPDTERTALEIQRQLADLRPATLDLVPIPVADGETARPARLCDLDITIDKDLVITPSRPGLVLGTSGTTGPPKGVVLTRNFLNVPMPEGGPDDTFITLITAANWIGGIWPPTRLLLKGTRVEIFDSQPNTPEPTWERIRQGGVTMLMAHATMWTDMMKYYIEKLSHLPADEREEYVRGARQVWSAMSGAVPIFPSVLLFWREILGRPLMNLYSAAEMGGGGLRTSADAETDIERSVGGPYAQLEVKLSEGDHGEILVRGPSVFSHYLDDPKATAAVFDEDGFYKTGDSDIKHHSYKVPIPELEMQLHKLPYADEVYAVPVPAPTVGEHIAVLIRLAPTAQGTSLALQKLRDDLLSVSALPVGYRPTMLRILAEGEDIPRSYTGKPLRKQIAKEFFPGPDGSMPGEGDYTIEVWKFEGVPLAQDFDQGSERRIMV